MRVARAQRLPPATGRRGPGAWTSSRETPFWAPRRMRACTAGDLESVASRAHQGLERIMGGGAGLGEARCQLTKIACSARPCKQSAKRLGLGGGVGVVVEGDFQHLRQALLQHPGGMKALDRRGGSEP